jgi:hypothetical protein
VAAWTEDDLATIRKAIAGGVMLVRFADGRERRYQNLDHLLAAERVIASALALADQAAKGAVRRRFGTFTSGK